MPFNERWRCFKIVAPLTPNREKDIVGGLRNAIERGETLEKAKRSFLNAGYKPEEVSLAAQKLPASTAQISTPMVTPTETQAPVAQSQPTTGTQALPVTAIPGQKKQASKKFMIILIIIGTLVLISAALLGVFWDKFF